MVLVTLAAGIGGLFLFEFYVSRTDPAARDYWWLYPRQPLPISLHPVATISTDDIYSVYPNLDYEGTAPWETRGRVPESRIFHIHSNRFGFYTEFPVDQFPPKQEKEFRIILVGGSGAQGHGGSTNDRMMYRILEKKLQQSLSDTGFKVRVINLALAGHEARTNSIVLRAFAHKLKPDMILAYNGANDIAQFQSDYWSKCAAYFETLIYATYIEPNWVRVLGEYFPALIYRYGLAQKIKRTFYDDEYRKRATDECFQDLGVDITRGRLKPALYRDVALPSFIENFKAIKRDFCGIPIMIAWQAIHDGERTNYDRWLANFDPQTNPVAVLERVNMQAVRVRFYNPEKRIIHFAIRHRGAAKPTWQEVIRSNKAFALDEADGGVTIKNSLPDEYAVTITARSGSGFNIIRTLPEGREILYVVLPAAASSASPTVESVVNTGKKLAAASVGYNFDPHLLTSGTTPTVYFVVKDGATTSAVFKAKEHAEFQHAPPPDIYYAMETAPTDQTKNVYRAYAEQDLNRFRRQSGIYQKFYESSKAALDQYMNRYWYFLNTDKLANDIDPATVLDMNSSSIAVHLDDVGQEVVAEIIHNSLKSIVRDLIHDPARAACAESAHPIMSVHYPGLKTGVPAGVH